MNEGTVQKNGTPYKQKEKFKAGKANIDKLRKGLELAPLNFMRD